jgi:hypothetical protein
MAGEGWRRGEDGGHGGQGKNEGQERIEGRSRRRAGKKMEDKEMLEVGDCE